MPPRQRDINISVSEERRSAALVCNGSEGKSIDGRGEFDCIIDASCRNRYLRCSSQTDINHTSFAAKVVKVYFFVLIPKDLLQAENTHKVPRKSR